MTAHITIRGARLHNLKNVTLTSPKHQFVVLTGLSGSGKSTLGFDILHKEGQRQYLEALGLAIFGLTKPPVDAITGLSPTISVDQHLTNHGPRSTVGTTTGVYTYLRVLFARLGHRPCPACGNDVPPSFDPANAEWEPESNAVADAAPEKTFPCPHCGAPVPEISMAHFSFSDTFDPLKAMSFLASSLSRQRDGSSRACLIMRGGKKNPREQRALAQRPALCRASSRSRCTSRMGGTPKRLLYSRLN